MFFLQFMLYSSSIFGTLIKNEIPEAAMELCQLKIKQLSPDILKFRTKHEDNQDNPFTLNCFVVSRSFLFIFHAGPRGLGPNKFRNSSYKEKTADSAPCFQTIFPFLMTMIISSFDSVLNQSRFFKCYKVHLKTGKTFFSYVINHQSMYIHGI